MSLEKLMKDREKIFNNAENSFDKDFHFIEQKIYNNILTFLLKTNINIDGLNKAFSIIEKIINEAVDGSGYRSRVSDYLTSFDKIIDNVAKVQKDVNSINISSKGLTEFQKFTINSVTGKMLRSGLNEAFITPLKEGLYKHLILGGSVDNAEKILRDFIISNEQKYSKFTRYVTQIARDSIYQYEGMINARIFQKYKMTAYRYTGSIIETSRAQCRKWADIGILEYKNLQKEIDWALQHGIYNKQRATGMIAETTPETFAVFRGGYSCRHCAVPTFVKKK